MKKNDEPCFNLQDQHVQSGPHGLETPIHSQSETNVQMDHLQREMGELMR